MPRLEMRGCRSWVAHCATNHGDGPWVLIMLLATFLRFLLRHPFFGAPLGQKFSPGMLNRRDIMEPSRCREIVQHYKNGK